LLLSSHCSRAAISLSGFDTGRGRLAAGDSEGCHNDAWRSLGSFSKLPIAGSHRTADDRSIIALLWRATTSAKRTMAAEMKSDAGIVAALLMHLMAFLLERDSVPQGKPTRPVSKPLSDIAARLQWLDSNKIERQVVGRLLDMFGNELPAQEGARWSRLINTHLLQAAKEQPRFVPLATVPLPGRRARRRSAEGSPQSGFKGRDDRHPAEGQGAACSTIPRCCRFGRRQTALARSSSSIRCSRSGDDRVHDYGMANAVGRIHRLH